MRYVYLYEKDDKNSNIIRKIFSSSDELFKYLLKNGECNFNSGYDSAEIRLNRIEKK